MTKFGANQTDDICKKKKKKILINSANHTAPQIRKPNYLIAAALIFVMDSGHDRAVFGLKRAA